MSYAGAQMLKNSLASCGFRKEAQLMTEEPQCIEAAEASYSRILVPDWVRRRLAVVA